MEKSVVRNLENSFQLNNVTKEQFKSFISKDKEDNFAKTFVSKCDMLEAWNMVTGYWQDDQLCGAILVTISKKLPRVANLQLLHTFNAHRRKGVAKELCCHGLVYAYSLRCQYFRVSSEPESVDFYKRLGIKFLGKQKSGCQLAMFQVISPYFEEIDYNVDSTIYAAMTKKGKGGCVETFVEYKGLDIFANHE
jgi:hypothetical protein